MSAPASHTIHKILHSYWGYTSFRPLQEEIINSVLQGNDTLALLPTGGGKSICYQVPAMALNGLCLVVSPLIALMKDQVETLRRKNITAFSITSANTRKEVEQILITAGNSNCKFLYVSPERLHTHLFREYLPGLGISLIAVDEAHCISQWGYDFRPAYLRIAELREELPNVPLLAVTASATPVVQDDICKQLQFHKHKVFQGSFLRPNLSFSVFQVDSKITKILQVLRNVAGTAIVYCKSRRMTQEVAELIRIQGFSADYYHAGLSTEERSNKQEAWIKNQIRVIVCTNAFGMGIDKPDVRVVIHHDVPDCLENYYQEAGRAGRDGQKAYAVLLYEAKDLLELQQLSEIRYPPVEEIKQVYQCLVNYLQVPAGSGEGQWMEFDIADFIKRFKLPQSTAVYSLQLLQQQGWITYGSQVFLPSKLEFTASKETLERFEKEHPQLEPVVKALLRTYAGIFDMETVISEFQLARILGKEKARIQQELTMLHQAGIAVYAPQKEKPLLQFLEDRPVTGELLIPEEQRLMRKEQFEKRVRVMLDYIRKQETCRSVVIARYFGDTKVAECGICDVCLYKNKTHLTPQEFAKTEQLLREKAGPSGLDLKQLLQASGTRQRQKIMMVVNHLVAEEKATLTENGFLLLEPSGLS
jgi:ATP-dependent DNA helicase RecQ